MNLRNSISDPIMRLQRFLRTVAAPDREIVELPPFTAYFHGTNPLKYFNYAIPADGAEPAGEEIDRLRAAFRERERLPRLEWIEEAAPRVAAALEDAGFREELRTPLMSCSAEELAEPAVDDTTLEPVGPENLRVATDIQRVAFGGVPLPPDEEPSPPSGGAVLARVGGEPASVGQWTRVSEACSEIVGIATAEAWRRRGLAGLVTAAAARGAFEAGATTCVLSPGDETAQRVYARAGFRRVATMLHYSDPV